MTDRRPSFSRDFPRTPALDALVDAFVRGDYALVRAEGAKLAASGEDEEVRRAARALVARTTADPLALWLLVIAGVLLVIVSAYWILREHASAPQGMRGSAVYVSGSLDPGSDLISRRACFHAR
jgi:hypothetical protein